MLRIYNLETDFANFVNYYAHKFPKIFNKLFSNWYCVAQASRRSDFWLRVVKGINELSSYEKICVVVIGLPVICKDLACTITPIVINDKPVYTIGLSFTEFIVWKRIVKELLGNVISTNDYALSTLMHEYFHFPSPRIKILSHRDFLSGYRVIMNVCPLDFWRFVFELDPFGRYGVDIFDLVSKLYPRISHGSFEKFLPVLTSFELISKLKSLGLVCDYCFSSPKVPKLIS